jgi:HPt (histidine-containing phosphotransfer) domain-containing protein
MLEAVRRALAAGDAPALARTAHALKGSVANFSTAEAADAAAELERLARAGVLTEARAAHRRVEEEVARVCQALRELAGEKARSAVGSRGAGRARINRGT